MSGDGLKLLHSWNDLAKMSLVGYVSVMAWFNIVMGWLQGHWIVLFLEWFGLIISGDGLKVLHPWNDSAKNVIGWFCFWNGLV